MKKSIKKQLDNLIDHVALITQQNKLCRTRYDFDEQKNQALKARKNFISLERTEEIDLYLLDNGFWANYEYINKNLICMTCKSEFNPCDCKF